MGLALPCPDHTMLLCRNARAAIKGRVDNALQRPISVIIDSTGLKVWVEGEWHIHQHGSRPRNASRMYTTHIAPQMAQTGLKTRRGVKHAAYVSLLASGTCCGASGVARRRAFDCAARQSQSSYGRSKWRPIRGWHEAAASANLAPLWRQPRATARQRRRQWLKAGPGGAGAQIEPVRRCARRQPAAPSRKDKKQRRAGGWRQSS